MKKKITQEILPGMAQAQDNNPEWIKEIHAYPSTSEYIIQKLEQKLSIATRCLEENANEDFRGNRSSSSIRSSNALEEIRKIK